MGEFDNFDNIENKDDRIEKKGLSKVFRAGKRTYFFDLKASRFSGSYLTITESKRRFNAKDNTYSHEKHKVFIIKENIQDFYDELGEVLKFIKENPDFGDIAENESANLERNSEELE